MRLWSRDWWTDKDQTIALIENRIAKAIQKITEEKALAKKKKSTAPKKEINIDDYIEENPLADNLFEKKVVDKPVISTRLNKKVLARLEEDDKNSEELDKQIKEISESADYNLVLDPIIFSDEMGNDNKKKTRKSKAIPEDGNIQLSIQELTTQEVARGKKEIAFDDKYIDEVEAKYEGKKDKLQERKNRQLDRAHEREVREKERAIARKQRQQEREEEKERKAQEREIAKQTRLKEQEKKKKQAMLDKRYNKKEMAKVKSQLDNLSTISALRKSKERRDQEEKPKKVSGIVPQKTMARKRVQKDELKTEDKQVNIKTEDKNVETREIQTRNTLATLEQLKNKTATISSNNIKKEEVQDKNVKSEDKKDKKLSVTKDHNSSSDTNKNNSLQSLLTKLQNKDK